MAWRARIHDQRVDMDLGFPDVHGPAYLSHPAVFEAILGRPEVRGDTSRP